MTKEASLYCRAQTFSTFTKDVRWSPDGTCILTCDDENTLKLFELPSESTETVKGAWQPVLQAKEGETIYDYCWYPWMTSSDPTSCCFVSSSRDHPLHLFDAFTGRFYATSCWSTTFSHLFCLNQGTFEPAIELLTTLTRSHLHCRAAFLRTASALLGDTIAASVYLMSLYLEKLCR